MNIILGFLTKVIRCWYFFFVILAITKMFYIPDWYSLLAVIVVVTGIRSMGKTQWIFVDFVVLLLILYGLISFSFSDYPVRLYYLGIKYQLTCTLFYFIGRSNDFRDDGYLNNFRWAMLIVIVFGILLYHFPPDWYVSYRYSELMAEEGTHGFYEHTRMSSFFPHPYFLGYGSCFFIICMVKQIFFNQRKSIFNYGLLLMSFYTLFFSQMRVAMAYTLMFFLIIAVSPFGLRKNYRKALKRIIVILVPLVGIFYFIVIKSIDADFMYYITERSVDYEGNLVEDRVDIFSQMYKYISLFGHGLGRFGHAAVSLNLPSAHDSDYVRWLCEQGYFGLTLFSIPLLTALVKGVMNINKTFVETFILLFFPFAMIGATPTESISQHTYMIWFCMGHIISKTQRYGYCNNNSKL